MDPTPGPGPRSVFVLKSKPAGPPGSHLPYRLDQLGDHGYEVRCTEEHRSGRLGRGQIGRLVHRSETLATPWAQAFVGRKERRRSTVTLAMFESEGHGVAAVRALMGGRGRPLVVIACWLADLARTAPPWRLRLYRRLYRSVDRVIVFSDNQSDTLVGLLGIEPDRIRVVRFGVDLDELGAVEPGDDGRVVAIGRDLGRDWATLATAAEGSGWGVDLVTRPSQVAGLALPPEIDLVGVLDREGYLRRLATAAVVVIPTDVREYPTGQTVLLEAMALGKACVVTGTPAMSSYVDPGVTALVVPPHDPAALRAAVDSLLADPDRRDELGRAARATSEASGGAAAMWGTVARILGSVASTGPGRR